MHKFALWHKFTLWNFEHNDIQKLTTSEQLIEYDFSSFKKYIDKLAPILEDIINKCNIQTIIDTYQSHIEARDAQMYNNAIRGKKYR